VQPKHNLLPAIHITKQPNHAVADINHQAVVIVIVISRRHQ
jgi:hypothetical protein